MPWGGLSGFVHGTPLARKHTRSITSGRFVIPN